MDWLQLITGIGIGTLGAKLLDIFWLQRRVEEHQRRTWLGDKRLEAFTELTKELLSFGLHENFLKTTFQSYGAASKALLLVDDELFKRIDKFLVDMDYMNRLTDSVNSENSQKAERAYLDLTSEAREIVKLLRCFILFGRSS